MWVGLALAAGVLAGRLPVMASGGALGAAVIAVAVLLEPALGLVLMLSLAPLKTLIATEAPLSLPIDIGQLALALAVAAWALWRITGRRWDPLPRTRLYLPLLAIMAAFSPSLIAAASTGAWLSEMLKWAEMLLLVGIVLDLAGEGRWAWIASGVVLAATLQAIIGLYEYFGGSGAPHLWIANFQHFRAFGTFGQPNPFSAFMGCPAVGAGSGVGLWDARAGCWRERKGGQWVVPAAVSLGYAACSLLLLGGLVASWGAGRGSVLARRGDGILAPRRRWQGGRCWRQVRCWPPRCGWRGTCPRGSSSACRTL